MRRFALVVLLFVAGLAHSTLGAPIVTYDPADPDGAVYFHGEGSAGTPVTFFLITSPNPGTDHFEGSLSPGVWGYGYASGEAQFYDSSGTPEGITGGPFQVMNVGPGLGLVDFGGADGVTYYYKDAPGSPETTAVTLVPEPATLSLLGLGAIALLRRRRA